MRIPPFALEGEEVFACHGKEIRAGQTRGSASAGVVSEMINMALMIIVNININININIVLVTTTMMIIMMAMVMIDTCEIVGGICRSLVGSSQQTLRPAIRN